MKEIFITSKETLETNPINILFFKKSKIQNA